MDRLNETCAAADKRIAALEERFREIGETVMKELPLYNDRLEVEAVGFRSWDKGWIGVLVTPWCMDVLLLNAEIQPMDYNAIGGQVEVELPGGARQFKKGGDDVLGLYLQLSLHSPTSGFAFQEAARVEAIERLDEFMTPPQESDAAMPPPAAGIDRRSFLRGIRQG
jgi:[NiFe] hydrogenase assembly HybE family chaperone